MLIGRTRERAAIDALVAGVRAGESGALVLHGEAGAGKSALLAYAAAAAGDATVLRCTGFEAEAELPFAGLHALLSPLVARLGGLPPVQAEALAGALGLSPAGEHDRFLVSVATLGLLAAAAEDAPLVALVDDAQWLDAPSAEALVFASRRLVAEGVGVLFAVRDGDPRPFPARGLPELAVGGLDAAAAGELLAARGPGQLPTATVERLVAATGGNPLALLELPLSAASAAHDEPGPAAVPVGGRVEEAFGARVRQLPAGVRELLVLAACDDAGDVAGLAAAADRLGLDLDDIGLAEEAGLVRIEDGRVRFRHPLVRSAVYGSATFAARRGAHLALAAAAGELDPDRRAWHRAAAALGPDAEVAVALDEVGDRATALGAHASAAAAHARAAALTPPGPAQAHRLTVAAQAAWAAGDVGRTRALLDRAEPASGADDRIELRGLRGALEARSGDGGLAIRLLVEAAGERAATAPARALELLLEAAEAASYAGDAARMGEIGDHVEALPPAARAADPPLAATLAGIGAAARGQPDRAAPLLLAAIAGLESATTPRRLIWGAAAALYAGQDDAARRSAVRAVEAARSTGRLGVLPHALHLSSTLEAQAGHLAAAEIAAEEGLGLARELGQDNLVPALLTTLVGVDAMRGREERCQERLDEATALPALGVLDRARLGWSAAILDLGAGRTEAALDRLLALGRPGTPGSHPLVALRSVPDLVEAAVRAGRPELAGPWLDRYAAWAEHGRGALGLALLERSLALLQGDSDTASAGFERSLSLHAACDQPFELAATELLYGEHLRRARRRVDARPHLRAAAEGFAAVGAAPWRDRAEVELRASGESARRRDPSTVDELTPQELQIARLVAGGRSNREVAAQLFLSPRTVDYHLRKIFAKLGISSRGQLAAAL